MLKRILIGIVLALAPFILIGLTLIFARDVAVKTIDMLYPRTAMITEINETDGIITITCANGSVFQFEAPAEDWIPGDLCSLIFHSNGTETVQDDRIIKVRYGGTVSHFAEIENAVKEN